MKVLGISCFYHDSAACLIENGRILAAAEEERFSREKHDNSFPSNAVDYCLSEAEIEASDLDKVVFYEKPILKFDRMLETAGKVFPRGYMFFSQALPEWLGTKLRVRKKIWKELDTDIDIEFVEHHTSHAASAFHPSPFEEAAVLTVDGVGEWKTNAMFHGKNDELEPVKHIDFPDSLGLLYSTLTSFLGFMVNNDEYKVMGLAPYGEPRFREEFERIIEVSEDGSYRLNQEFFSYQHRKKMWSSSMKNLLGEPRKEGEKIKQRHKDIAATLQEVLEDVLLKQCEHLHSVTGSDNLCLAGGVALNSAANGRVRRESPFENVWIQPAAGDDGGALGAALEGSNHEILEMEDVYLGPSYTQRRIKEDLDGLGASYSQLEREELLDRAVSKLVDGEVIGLYQGRLEWGPRALGNRSILADPRKAEMKDKVNGKIKFREGFRPFAPTVLEEHASDYFEIEGESPYMLFIQNVREEKKEDIPAVTHVNGTSRIQTLKRKTNPFYYDLIKRFYDRTGVPVILNTSFNLRGMPIVNTPEEAYRCFQESGLDAILTRNLLVDR